MSDYVDKKLKKMAKGGKFIRLDEGDSFKGKYLTWKSEMDEKYKKLKPVFYFVTEKGEEKQLGTSAKKFIAKMSKVVPGSTVMITKLGEGPKTDYSVKTLVEAKMPKDTDEDEEEDEEEDEDEDEAPKKKKKVAKEEDDEEEEDDENEDEEEDEEDEEDDSEIFGK